MKTNTVVAISILLAGLIGCHQTEESKLPDLSGIQLPEGYSISVYAQVPDARSMCWGEKGTLFVGNRKEDKVYALRDEDGDGVAEKKWVIATGLNTPNGVAFKNGSLYIAEINRILRMDAIEEKLDNPPAPVVVTDKLPDKTWHGWKFIAFGPDGKLYVPVGAPCNVCESEDSLFASILRMDADGSNLEIYAKGVRNSVGFSWHPVTNQLWFTDNGRDLMGDDMPSCELNFAPEKGMHFGFPYIHQGNLPDPEFASKKPADLSTQAPAALLGPHVAPLGMRFYTGNQFDSSYRHAIFIAEHGSWNRTNPIGYKVGVAFLNDKQEVTSYKPFAEGWLKADGKVTGRPVDIELDKTGALLVSDDYAGCIYRIAKK
jgi:glucose/arabinose dehydrogenase